MSQVIRPPHRLPTRPSGEPERRRQERIPVGRRVDVQFVAKPSYRACWALLLDASPDGIAMFSAEAVVPGTSIALRIYTPNPDADPMVAAEVGHCTPSASGGWILGCKLRRAFSREELLALVATDVSVLCFKL